MDEPERPQKPMRRPGTDKATAGGGHDAAFQEAAQGGPHAIAPSPPGAGRRRRPAPRPEVP